MSCRRLTRDRELLECQTGGAIARFSSLRIMPIELSRVCCDRDPVPSVQRAAIKRLLSEGADLHATDKNGVTALHHAVRFRSPAAVETLVDAGANVNQACKRSGGTPLHRAVTPTGAPGTAGRREQTIEVIRILLRNGADPNIKNRLGKTPGDYVKDNEILEILRAGTGQPDNNLHP